MGFLNSNSSCWDCRNLDKNDSKYGEYYCLGWRCYVSASKIADNCRKFDPWFVVTSICNVLGLNKQSEIYEESKKLKDEFLLNNEEGKSFIETYNKYGPVLRDNLQNEKEKERMALTLLNSFLMPIIEKIVNNNYEEAFLLYQSMFYDLISYYNIPMEKEDINLETANKPLQRTIKTI